MFWSMAFTAAALLVVCGFILYAIWRLFHWNSATHEAALIFQSIVTGAAILAAGYFYFVERRSAPKLDVSQTLSVFRVDQKYVTIESVVSIKNLGYTLLKLRDLDARLQKITPNKLAMEELGKLKYDVWPQNFGNKDAMYSGTEMTWPIVRYASQKMTRDIEPGENDTIVLSFIVSCDIHVLKLSTQLKKPGYTNRWWKTVSFVDTRAACNQSEITPEAR